MHAIALALTLLLQGGKATFPEVHADFAPGTGGSADLEIEVEAVGFPAGESGGGAKPRTVRRYVTWHAGGTDLEELARMSAEALKSGGLDASSDGKSLIVKNATELAFHAKSWASVSAQVWGLIPADAKDLCVRWKLQPMGALQGGALAVSIGDRPSGPPAPEEALTPPAAAKDTKPNDPKSGAKPASPAKPAAPAKTPAKPADAKGKPAAKPTAATITVPKGDSASLLEALRTKAADLEWKIDSEPGSLVRVTPRAGAPATRWAAVRYAGASEMWIGVKIAPAAADAK